MPQLPRIGIALRSQGRASSTLDLAKRAESGGFDSVWLVEVSEADVIGLAGAISQVTEKIKIASGVVNSTLRLPTLLAMCAATIADLSNGRFILGIGAGDSPMSFTTAVPEDTPLTRLRETIQIVRQCFTGESVDFDGRLYQVHGFSLPIGLSSNVPIFGAAMGLKMVENVASVANGVLAMMPTIEHAREVRRAIESVAKKLSLDKEPSLACHIITAVSTSTESAEEIAKRTILDYLKIPVYRESIKRMGFSREAQALEELGLRIRENLWEEVPTSMASRLVVYGTPEECVEKINTFAAEGVSHPIIYSCKTSAGFPQNVSETIDLLSPYT